MRHLTVEEILYLHYRLIKTTGGAPGIRDLGLLESAAARPLAGFAKTEAYQSVFDKAAVLAHSIIANHPFIDGNKRTGIASAVLFLRKNGFFLKTAQKEMVDFTLKIARGEAGWPEISDWLERHCIKSQREKYWHDR
jgi:death-on-curing protein